MFDMLTEGREKDMTDKIQTEMTLYDKLNILTDAAKYDVACTSSGVDRRGDGTGMGNCSSGDDVAVDALHSAAAEQLLVERQMYFTVKNSFYQRVHLRLQILCQPLIKRRRAHILYAGRGMHSHNRILSEKLYRRAFPEFRHPEKPGLYDGTDLCDIV